MRDYACGSRPPREQILETLVSSDGSAAAILTRNAYGAVVLNAAYMLFVDVDLPPPTLRDRLARLVGRTGIEPAPARLRERLESIGGSFRLYRTAAGLRVIATDRIFTPGSPNAERLMRELGADPAFVQLCRAQKTFRARLTPKPWRCGLQAPSSDFPRQDGEALRQSRPG